MIDSTMSPQDTTPKPKYPYLGYLTHDGSSRVVLFNAPKTGTQVSATGVFRHQLGEYRNDWLEHNFTLYNGEVELTNNPGNVYD